MSPGLLIIFAFSIATLVGCSEKSAEHIAGPYYFQTTKRRSLLSEPGGASFEFQLVLQKTGKTTIISTNPLAIGIAFQWHTYGDNLAFVEGGSSSKADLVVFSERKGSTMIDQDVDNPLGKSPQMIAVLPVAILKMENPKTG
jgi:hypothetical protein